MKIRKRTKKLKLQFKKQRRRKHDPYPAHAMTSGTFMAWLNFGLLLFATISTIVNSGISIDGVVVAREKVMPSIIPMTASPINDMAHAGTMFFDRDKSKVSSRDKTGTTAYFENNDAPQTTVKQWVAEHVAFQTEREGFLSPCKHECWPADHLHRFLR